jgi:hypothetical protein
MQENPSLGPMEETSLDFENLVLGKKSAPSGISSTSPPIAAYQHQTIQQGFINPQSSTPMTVMTPKPPPPPSGSFFQPLQPSPYTAPPSSSAGSTTRNGLFSSPSTAFSASSNSGNGFSASNTLWSNNNATSNLSLPTIAPPPAKANTGFPPQTKPAAAGGNYNGLEKYQSLL